MNLFLRGKSMRPLPLFFTLPFMLFLAAFPPAGHIGQPCAGETDSVLKVTVGQAFEIRLPGNPSTGFIWVIEHLPRFLEQLGEREYLPDRISGVGAGGVHVWRFRARVAGEDELRFAYRRLWEKDVPPAERAARRIVVKE
ncbi:MAG: protease inhibitor I42 family protein [Desulfovibrio sp.]|jgi:inhibitor of cysteine peptidase|nr:protease inhibitor I42 family protein [Desulfovibrio sp.]